MRTPSCELCVEAVLAILLCQAAPAGWALGCDLHVGVHLPVLADSEAGGKTHLV